MVRAMGNVFVHVRGIHRAYTDESIQAYKKLSKKTVYRTNKEVYHFTTYPSNGYDDNRPTNGGRYQSIVLTIDGDDHNDDDGDDDRR